MLVCLIAMSLVIFAVSKIKVSDISFVLTFILIFLLLNNLAIFLFSPEEGVRIMARGTSCFTSWGDIT